MGLKIACVTMIRNESPVLSTFLDQVAEFFDYCFLIDHQSNDDSIEAINSRPLPNLNLFHLVSDGYPQSEVTTLFVRRAFETTDADFVFPIDCDEFLPFTNRGALEKFLGSQVADVIELPWLNICPGNLDGGDIFKGRFYRAAAPSFFPKVIISRSAWDISPDLTVGQGNHAVNAAQPLKTVRQDDTFLLHIPVRSKLQIYFKLVSGHNRLMFEKDLIRKKHGIHWKELADELRLQKMSNNILKDLALHYPNTTGNTDAEFLEFDFPYIKSAYAEDYDYISQGVISLLCSEEQSRSRAAFSVLDSEGEVISTSANIAENDRATDEHNDAFVKIPAQISGDNFVSLVEPLFSLPAKMPDTAWSGHIPFMFVMFKMLQPKCYVELGVYNGASLIAACTAARQHQLETKIFGIDSWKGDEHSGVFDGDALYSDLRSYLSRTFRNVTLIRSYFADARPSFRAGSIDLLHIDGLHTYDAVREDFVTWLPAMSGSGVILFHDTNVHDRGFGVHRLWNELTRIYRTVEFKHSYGLGVLFLNDTDPRLEPLIKLSHSPEAWNFYRDLASLVAEGLPERMGWIDATRRINELEAEVHHLRQYNHAILNSRSWKLTQPIRSIGQPIRSFLSFRR